MRKDNVKICGRVQVCATQLNGPLFLTKIKQVNAEKHFYKVSAGIHQCAESYVCDPEPKRT